MKRHIANLLSILLFSLLFTQVGLAKEATFPAPSEGCLSYHEGIEPIKEHDSLMAMQLYAMGGAQGDPNGCVVCHGGNPKATTNAKAAHSGAPPGNLLGKFTPTPGAFAVDRKSTRLNSSHVSIS